MGGSVSSTLPRNRLSSPAAKNAKLPRKVRNSEAVEDADLVDPRWVACASRAVETGTASAMDVLQTEDGGWRSVVGGGQLRNHAATPNSVWMN